MRFRCPWFSSATKPPPTLQLHPSSTTQTQRTQPHGHVLRVWGVPAPSLPFLPPPRHEGRDHMVAFFVSGMSLPLLLPRHKECDDRVAFFVSGMLLTPSTAQTRRSRPCGRVLRAQGIPPTTSRPRHRERDPIGSHSLCLGCSPSFHLIQT